MSCLSCAKNQEYIQEIKIDFEKVLDNLKETNLELYNFMLQKYPDLKYNTENTEKIYFTKPPTVTMKLVSSVENLY